RGLCLRRPVLAVWTTGLRPAAPAADTVDRGLRFALQRPQFILAQHRLRLRWARWRGRQSDPGAWCACHRYARVRLPLLPDEACPFYGFASSIRSPAFSRGFRDGGFYPDLSARRSDVDRHRRAVGGRHGLPGGHVARPAGGWSVACVPVLASRAV